MSMDCKAVKWAWHHYSMECEVYDSLDEAIESAIWAEEAGSEALDCIEHGGERISWDHPAMEAVRQRIRVEDEKRRARARPATHVIEVRHPDCRWVGAAWIVEPMSRGAREQWDDFVAALGQDRVRLSPLDASDTQVGG